MVFLTPYKPLIEIVLVFSFLLAVFYKLSQVKPFRSVLFALGMMMLAYYAARSIDFQLLARLLELSFLVAVLGFLVLFQPELRRLIIPLSQGGASGWMGKMQANPAPQEEQVDKSYILQELMEAVRILSKRKIGALIVYETDSENRNIYLEMGTPIGARVSSELLLTIFHPNTPLHDGAVIINSQGLIVSAGVLLPLSENPKLSWEYGTRHRAAVGLTEVSANTCLVVSEETGRVSLAQKGQINRLPDKEAIESGLLAVVGSDSAELTLPQRRVPFLGDLFSADFFQRFFTPKT